MKKQRLWALALLLSCALVFGSTTTALAQEKTDEDSEGKATYTLDEIVVTVVDGITVETTRNGWHVLHEVLNCHVAGFENVGLGEHRDRAHAFDVGSLDARSGNDNLVKRERSLLFRVVARLLCRDHRGAAENQDGCQ